MKSVPQRFFYWIVLVVLPSWLEAAPAAPDNLVALARAVGYVRHFHPSDQAAEADWQAIAARGVEPAEAASDPAALVRALRAVLEPVAPTVQIFENGEKPKLPEALSPGDTSGAKRFLRWSHRGYGGPVSTRPYQSELVSTTWSADTKSSWKPEVFEAPLAGGVRIRVPLTVLADEQGSLPQVAAGPVRAIPADERATRLAAVMLGWNVLQHFYPYFEFSDTDWSDVLPRALADAADDRGADDFTATLERMVAGLDDGHGFVLRPRYDLDRYWMPPLLLAWVEGRVVVLHLGEVAGVKRGDVLRSIDGRDVNDILRELESRISGATAAWKRARALPLLLHGREASEVVLEIERGEQKVTVRARRTLLQPDPRTEKMERLFGDDLLPPPTLTEPRPAAVEQLKPGLWYLDAERLDQEAFAEAVTRARGADGIVFDVRGYPSTWIAPWLSERRLDAVDVRVPLVLRPDRSDWQLDGGSWQLRPAAEPVTAPLVFLTDARAISAAETLMAFVETHELAPIVGQATAGTNGMVNLIELAGGYKIIWTGAQVLKPDGSRHHGIGIRPTVPLERTIAGVRAGRDEQLEQALRILSSD